MKHGRIIIFLLLAFFWSACHHPAVKTPCPVQQQELSIVDSLMWTQPDSALTRLLSCYDTIKDRHYANLLLAELLYKNYYEQTNRAELLKAVAYYDSASCPFLAARAHYINGVGYYEHDSVVPACEEYLKALEIMEEHFDKKELTEQKAKFLALTNTRLCGLFTAQYLHEQAIYFGKSSLPFYDRYNAEFGHVAWVLDNIGLHYQMIGRLDSASYYFEQALTKIPDTNNITYRDAATAQAMLSYHTGQNPHQAVLKQLHDLLVLSESDDEYLSRCLTIGNVFYIESQYDSAWKYLNTVFDESTKNGLKKQAADWLIDICRAQGKDNEILEYANFLTPFANQEENKSELKSKLTELYRIYIQNKLERQHYDKTKYILKRVTVVFMGLLLVMLALVFLYFKSKKRKHNLEILMEEERHSHRIQQAALGGRLKSINSALKELKETQETQPLTESLQQDFTGDYSAESICQQIIKICNDKQNPIKSTVSVSAYAQIALNDKQKAQLREAALRHYGRLFENLKKQYPSLKEKDFMYCYLCLLGLNNVQISVLLQKSISTIWSRENHLQKIFGQNDCIAVILHGLMND